ncbi:MAG: hypothetical protein R3A51_15450 [Nannocystaceae bacterium]
MLTHSFSWINGGVCLMIAALVLSCGPGGGASTAGSETDETGASEASTGTSGETDTSAGGSEGSTETGGSTTDAATSETSATTTEPSSTDSESTTEAGSVVTLLGAGYYYGECGGACKGDLTLQGDALAHAVTGWEDDSFGAWTGALTDVGAAERAAVEQLLGTITIAALYGCPDGADGGGGYLLLDIDGAMVRTDYPLDGACEEAPPEILQANAFVAPIMAGFAQCAPTSHFTIDEPCTPVVDP